MVPLVCEFQSRSRVAFGFRSLENHPHRNEYVRFNLVLEWLLVSGEKTHRPAHHFHLHVSISFSSGFWFQVG